jgi:MoaE-MoaD fusion protein
MGRAMSESKVVRVLALGSAATLLGWSERELHLGRGDGLAALLAALEAECPALAAARARLRFAINQRYATLDHALAAGDEIALIPPVSGG